MMTDAGLFRALAERENVINYELFGNRPLLAMLRMPQVEEFTTLLELAPKYDEIAHLRIGMLLF